MKHTPRTLTLDDVFNEFVDKYDEPTEEALESLSRDYPQFRDELVDFAAAWEKQLTSPVGSELSEDEEEALIDNAMNFMRAYCQERVPDNHEELSAAMLWGLPKTLVTMISKGLEQIEVFTAKIPQSAMAYVGIVCLLLLVAISPYRNNNQASAKKDSTSKPNYAALLDLGNDTNNEVLKNLFNIFNPTTGIVDGYLGTGIHKAPENDEKIDIVALTSILQGVADARTSDGKEIRHLVTRIGSLVTHDDQVAVTRSLDEDNLLDVIEESPTEEAEEVVRKAVYSIKDPNTAAIVIFLAVLKGDFEDTTVEKSGISLPFTTQLLS